MDETTYSRLADAYLDQLLARIEAINDEIECELSSGVLTMQLPSGKHIVVNKHTASRQIWLAIPGEGGFRFTYKDGQWLLPDGRELDTMINQAIG